MVTMHKWQSLVTIMLCCLVLLTGCVTTHRFSRMMSSEDSSDEEYSRGVSYLLGQGVPQNQKAALSAFRRAAYRGNPYAEAQLGFMYATGQGVVKNEKAAFDWYQLAADHGLASAQYNLGLMLLHGIGTPPNPLRAREWFKQASLRGFAPASRALSR